MTIDLDPELESRLREEAAKYGLDAEELVFRLIEQSLPARGANQNSLAPLPPAFAPTPHTRLDPSPACDGYRDGFSLPGPVTPVPFLPPLLPAVRTD